jgi:type VI secretion system secreted protein Hcp
MADIFLTLAGIKGETTDATFRGATELYSVNWGSDLPEISPGKFGPAQLDQIVVSKAVDSTSPLLLQALNGATPITSGRISFRKPGELKAAAFLVIDLVDVVVRRIVAESSGPEGRPSEQVSLEFRGATWTYSRQNADGSYSVVSSFTWTPAPVA